MNPEDSKREQAPERAHHDEGGAAIIGIYDVSEADEAATSKEAALENLRDQVVNDEAMAVIDMYERAAWAVVRHGPRDRTRDRCREHRAPRPKGGALMLRERPRKGQHLRFNASRPDGSVRQDPASPLYEVTEVRDDGIAWIKRPAEPATCFIWRFADGEFNRLAEAGS